MSEAKIELVEPQGLTINLPIVGAPVAVRTKGDEVIILMRLRLRPWDNVMNVNLDISTRRDGAAVARLDKDTPAQFSRY
jgi:hypothetical protein